MRIATSRRVAWSLAGVLLACGIPLAHADDSRAKNFDRLDDPMECTFIMVSANNIAESRDKGVSKKQIVEWARTLDKFKIPPEVIDGIYAFPKVRPLDHAAYWSWRCRAQANDLPFGSLKSVEKKLFACPPVGNVRSDCLRQVKNQLLGLPADYVPQRETPSTAIQDVSPRESESTAIQDVSPRESESTAIRDVPPPR
jgi:hypothetical protein